MKLGIISNNNHQKSYDSITITKYQNDDDSSIADNDEEDVVLENCNRKNSFFFKKYAMHTAAIIGIAFIIIGAATSLLFVNDVNTNVNNDIQLLSSLSDDDWRNNYAFQEGMFQHVLLADKYGRTIIGYEDNPVIGTGYCQYLQAQLKDDNGNWKLATFNIDKYIYVDKEGELQYADAEKQPGHYAYSIKSCYLEVSRNVDCEIIYPEKLDLNSVDDSVGLGTFYDVTLHAETMYSGGVFGNKDKTKKNQIIHMKLGNNNGSFVDHLSPLGTICECHFPFGCS